MIYVDFECRSGHITEHLVHAKQKKADCSICGKTAKRIISMGRVNTANDAPGWLRSTLEVVDRSNPASHVQEFVKHPTRANYTAWMKGEGIRPLDHTEHGAPPAARKPDAADLSRVYREVMDRYRGRQRLEVRG